MISGGVSSPAPFPCSFLSTSSSIQEGRQGRAGLIQYLYSSSTRSMIEGGPIYDLLVTFLFGCGACEPELRAAHVIRPVGGLGGTRQRQQHKCQSNAWWLRVVWCKCKWKKKISVQVEVSTAKPPSLLPVPPPRGKAESTIFNPAFHTSTKASDIGPENDATPP